MAYGTKLDEYGYHANAVKVLKKVKQQRAKKNFKVVRVDKRTWKEVEVK